MESSLPGRVGTGKMWVWLLLAVLVQPGSPAPPQQLCHATDPRPYLLAATKTGYTPLLDSALPAAPLPASSGCGAPNRVWAVARHGTRLPSTAAIRQVIFFSFCK